MIPNIPADCKLETISIVPVAEALRVGEGPYDPKYHEVTYYHREYRKKYKNDILARFAASAILFRVGKASLLRRVQVSGDLCTLDELAEHDWPNLDTLILTGHAPRLHSTTTELVDVLVKMPKLTELRLLFATTKGDASFRVVPQQVSAKNNDASVFKQLKHLALSNACKLSGVFRYTAALERLAVCAIIDHPWVPIALSRSDVDGMLKDMAVECETSKLKRLRIMVEDKVSPELCRDICIQCPVLEALEVEICGYHDGKPVFAWVSLTFPPTSPRSPFSILCRANFQEHFQRSHISVTSGYVSSSPSLTKRTSRSRGGLRAKNVPCTSRRRCLPSSALGSSTANVLERIGTKMVGWSGIS